SAARPTRWCWGRGPRCSASTRSPASPNRGRTAAPMSMPWHRTAQRSSSSRTERSSRRACPERDAPQSCDARSQPGRAGQRTTCYDERVGYVRIDLGRFRVTRSASRDPDWVGLSEASRVLGVSPATLRRWSDAGRLRVFTTPGGHRRFSRAALERLLPTDRARRPSLSSAGLTPSRIAQTYRRASRKAAPELPWVLRLSDEQ